MSINFMEIMTLLRTDFSNYLGTLIYSRNLEVSHNDKKNASAYWDEVLRIEEALHCTLHCTIAYIWCMLNQTTLYNINNHHQMQDEDRCWVRLL